MYSPRVHASACPYYLHVTVCPSVRLQGVVLPACLGARLIDAVYVKSRGLDFGVSKCSLPSRSSDLLLLSLFLFFFCQAVEHQSRKASSSTPPYPVGQNHYQTLSPGWMDAAATGEEEEEDPRRAHVIGVPTNSYYRSIRS